MPELWFYHLEREPSESLLPQLLRRGLERGLRLSVELAAAERLASWSSILWAYEDAGFLPHGVEGDRGAAGQPIWLTDKCINPNNSRFRFYVDGAVPDIAWLKEEAAIERASILFEGSNETATGAARELWRQARGAGILVRYQRQDEAGGWSEAAPSSA